jgi:hypothetical protein
LTHRAKTIQIAHRSNIRHFEISFIREALPMNRHVTIATTACTQPGAVARMRLAFNGGARHPGEGAVASP